MSIEEFGASLLSDVRKRKDQQYDQYMRDQRKAQSRADKEARKRALIGVGLRLGTKAVSHLGKSFLSDKTEEFLNNSKYYDNALTMQNATSMQEKAFKRQKELEKFEGGADAYFMTQALPQVNAVFGSSPEFDISTKSKQEVETARNLAAGHLGQKLKAAHESQFAAAQRLAAGDITYEAYAKEVAKAAPTTFTKYAIGKIKGMFSGGEDPVTSGLRLNGVLDKAEDEKTYYNIYKESRDGFTASTIMELIKDNNMDLGRPDITYGKIETVKAPVSDIFGKASTEEMSVKQVLLNGVPSGQYVDALTNRAIPSNVEPSLGQEIDKASAQISDTQTNIIMSKVTLNTSEKEREVFDAALELITGGNKGGTPTEQAKRNADGRRMLAGRVLKTRNELLKNFNVPSPVAYQVATKAHMLRYQSVMDRGFGGYITDEADFTDDIMPNKTYDSLTMYLSLELAQKEGLKTGIPKKQLLDIKKNLLNSVQMSGFKTLHQRQAIMGVTDENGQVVERGLIDDARFMGLNLREKLLNVSVGSTVQKASPTPEAMAEWRKYTDPNATEEIRKKRNDFLSKWDSTYTRPVEDKSETEYLRNLSSRLNSL